MQGEKYMLMQIRHKTKILEFLFSLRTHILELHLAISENMNISMDASRKHTYIILTPLNPTFI